MPILTDKNTNYGPPLVSQKYSPLLNIQYVPADQAVYSALLTNRWNLLTAANVLPQPLALAVPNWAATIAAEAGHNPPLVVISSNRSNWIAAGIAAANTELVSLGIAAFTNASDLRALGAHAGQTISPPIYCPTRLGAAPNRNVYIVVHISEYDGYKNTLAGTGLTVVGWTFRTLPGAHRLTGFGASRFAAIAFCKHLRDRAAARAAGVAPWDYAWLLDDNVVALTSFPGFAAVEGAMTPAHVCAGLGGGTKAETFQTNRDWARSGRGGGQTGGVAGSATPAIIQQAALWNIDYLTLNNINFGRVYVTSGEDLSLGNYFDTQPIPYFHYNGIGVVKEVPYADNGLGAQATNTARQNMAAWFSAAESAVPPLAPPPPPPVNVQPTNIADGGVQTLANFVANRVLPNSLMNAQAGIAAVQDTANCQAVEQITCGAIQGAIQATFVAPAARAQTFQDNLPAAQVIVQRDWQ